MGEQTRTEKELENQVRKWLSKAENRYKTLRYRKKPDVDLLENINAYLLDTKYFMERKDWINAFEAVIWAWAWIEIGLELKILETEEKTVHQQENWANPKPNP